MTTPAPYENAVERHLRLRGRTRSRALADLGDLVRELRADGVEPEDALGTAADYAAALDAEFGTSQTPRTIGEFASAIGTGIGRRMAGTFDPADSRILVPRVVGLGWDFNMGAIAARLGLLRPDDMDQDTLDSAVRHHATPAKMIAGGTTALAAAGAVAHGIARTVRARRGQEDETLPVAHILEFVVPSIAGALIAGSNNEDTSSGQRLTMPALAALISAISAGASFQSAFRPNGDAIAAAGGLGGLGLNFLIGYLPVRAALEQQWEVAEQAPAGPWDAAPATQRDATPATQRDATPAGQRDAAPTADAATAGIAEDAEVPR